MESIWVFNPLKNFFVVFTPFGLGTTAVILLLICLITKKGYIWFSGYKYTHDPRGFDILPDGTHGTSGFLTKKEMGEFLELGKASEVRGMMLGKYKQRPDDLDKYALYVAHHMRAGDNSMACSTKSLRELTPARRRLSSHSFRCRGVTASPDFTRFSNISGPPSGTNSDHVGNGPQSSAVSRFV